MIGPIVAAAVVAAAAVMTLAYLRRPLLLLLTELCSSEERARFWWRVSATELLVGTGVTTSLATVFDGYSSNWSTAATVIRVGLAGLLLSLAAITAGALIVGQGTRPSEEPRL